ncbi:hymolysin-related protein [Candidatus Phytoplasma luffae]|uniref:Hymolysin-related protein n=1 Tax=Loofah witches'-broom phytoplasma TaxID=35773 RepID=A0A975ILP2_LOWBP|nr:hemolysin family protein [Candidatus Phytoplasma luffae]QTX02617.1 hymolysin-related protein [Candidatus Phytoplasma luffae]
METITIIFIIFILILLNAFLSFIEVSLISLNPNKIELRVKQGFKKDLKIKKIKEKPNLFLSVVQIIIHILTFSQGIIINNFQQKNDHYNHYYIEVSVVLCSLIFGELLPKRIALAFPLKIAYLFISLFNIICFFMQPFVWVLNKISDFILFILRIDTNVKGSNIEEEELRFLLNSSYKTGVINTSKKNMLQNVFDFDDTLVSDIMRHRKEIAAINSDITKEELIEFISHEKYTRFPVYEDNMDKIIGIVHVKDIFKGLLTNGNNKFNIKKFLRKPYYVLEFQHISELFKEMKIKQNHIAIVIDEYGGTSGIVTIEDVIEEILGDIQDEYDQQSKDITKISDKEYLIKGTTHLDEIENNLQIDLPLDNYDTLNGFILGKLKRMPEPNEKIQIIHNDWKFESEKYDGLVIKMVRVTKVPKLEPSL